jgi:beta-xylosidase
VTGVRASAGSGTPSRRWVRVGAAVAGVAVLVAGVIVLVQALRTTPCDNVHFRSAAGPVNAASQPPAIGRLGIVRDLRQFFHGGSSAVFCDDFPDPYVLRVGHDYYAYATNTDNKNVPVLATHGFFGTGGRRDVLPVLPAWAEFGWVWAPSVLPVGSGYVLYYSARVRGQNQECLSSAISTKPLGPFVDASSGPAVCPPGGAIDPSPFVDASGAAYLVWKNERSIVSQRLAADGRTLVGAPTTLLQADQPWEAGIVEGPAMTAAGGRYYLFYSGNQWQTGNYAIGYAVCSGPSGPCVKAPGPWLASGTDAQGPGGPDFFTDPSGQLWLSLAAWGGGQVGYPQGARDLFVLRLSFPNGVPTAN